MKNHKQNILLLSVIPALVLTSLFLVVKATALFVLAYAFALGGIALLCAGLFFLLGNIRSYPWVAAFPRILWRYLIWQLFLSTVFVVLDQFAVFSLPWPWFLVFHIVSLGVFGWALVILKSGKEIIEARGEEVKAKVGTLRLMHADVESLARKFPAHEKALKPVADALRYSDPMSHASLAVCEEQIQRGILALDDGGDVASRCADLLRLIADRNARARVLK